MRRLIATAIVVLIISVSMGGCANKKIAEVGDRWVKSFGQEVLIVDFNYINKKKGTCSINISVVGRDGSLKSGGVHVFPQNQTLKTEVTFSGQRKTVAFSCKENNMAFYFEGEKVE